MDALYDADFQVPFLPFADMEYGYDTLMYPAMDINGWYPSSRIIAGNSYNFAWKSLPRSTTDPVKAITRPSGSIGEVNFTRSDSSVVASSVIGGENAVRVEASREGGSRETSHIFAIQEKRDSNDQVVQRIAGQLNLVEYDEETLNLVIVPVNGASPTGVNLLGEDFNVAMSTIFKQAVVRVNLSIEASLSVPEVGVVADNASGIASYNSSLRRIIRAHQDQVVENDDAIYIFLVDQHENPEKVGFMPRKRNHGFIFLSGLPSGGVDESITPAVMLARAIGHEVGHGAYHLQHIIQETQIPERTTDNLMDYAGGGRLHKWQWDLIHDPVYVAGLFEGDEDGSGEVTLASTEFNQIMQAIGLYAAAYCQLCTEGCATTINADNFLRQFAPGSQCIKCIFFQQELNDELEPTGLVRVPLSTLFEEEAQTIVDLVPNDNLANYDMGAGMASYFMDLEAGENALFATFSTVGGVVELSQCVQEENFLSSYCADFPNSNNPTIDFILNGLNNNCEGSVIFPFADDSSPVSFENISSTDGDFDQVYEDLITFINSNGYENTEIIYEDYSSNNTESILRRYYGGELPNQEFAARASIDPAQVFRIHIRANLSPESNLEGYSVDFELPDDYFEVAEGYYRINPGTPYTSLDAKRQFHQFLSDERRLRDDPRSLVLLAESSIPTENPGDGNFNVREANYFEWAVGLIEEGRFVVKNAELDRNCWHPTEQPELYNSKLVNCYTPVAGVLDGALNEVKDLYGMVDLCGQLYKDPGGTTYSLIEGVVNIDPGKLFVQLLTDASQAGQQIISGTPEGQYLVTKLSLGTLVKLVIGGEIMRRLSKAGLGNKQDLLDKIRSLNDKLEATNPNLVRVLEQMDRLGEVSGELVAKFAKDFDDVTDFSRFTEGMVGGWKFAFEGALIRTNVNVLESISTALQRGIKDIPYVVSHANHPNIITYTVEHIFRGHGNNGGRHHISALIADNTRKLTNRLKETTDGFYEAVIKRSDGTTSTKSFWPDTWDENKIMDELKHVMANNPINITGNTWEGFTTTGQKINYYVKTSDNSIISAFPVLD